MIYKILFFAVLAFFISCAGLGIKPTAQSEFDLGLAIFNQGQFEKAIPHFQKATEHDPNFARGYFYLGRAYLNIGKWREAIPPLRTAFKLAPEESKNEIADILMDVILQYALKFEQNSQSQPSDILKK